MFTSDAMRTIALMHADEYVTTVSEPVRRVLHCRSLQEARHTFIYERYDEADDNDCSVITANQLGLHESVLEECSAWRVMDAIQRLQWLDVKLSVVYHELPSTACLDCYLENCAPNTPLRMLECEQCGATICERCVKLGHDRGFPRDLEFCRDCFHSVYTVFSEHNHYGWTDKRESHHGWPEQCSVGIPGAWSL